MSETAETPTLQEISRELPPKIVIPEIKGEMVHLRPATIEDLPRLDELDAYYNASRITGKDPQAERAVVHAWVRRSVAWANGQAASESGVGDPESRRTIAWAVLTDSDHDDDGRIDAADTDNVIGMVFLIDIDGWARSARIQVVLGKDYRGRGYSRDMMPRVMTYGFAPEPSGLGMHRIWVAVPEKNTRSLSVYQSLGFVKTGSSRDALWDAENGRYQDLIVLDTLFDEYDPIRSLDAFGMHVIEDNPGMHEALAMREHSIAIRQRTRTDDSSSKANNDADRARRDAFERIGIDPDAVRSSGESDHTHRDGTSRADAGEQPSPASADAAIDGDSTWPYGQSERKSSKNAWWRNLGLSRKRDNEEDR